MYDCPGDRTNSLSIQYGWGTEKGWQVRICFDPQYLNRFIMRCHYLLLTVEEVTTRLTNVKLLVYLMLKPTEASSYRTTFNAPFGCHRLKPMPFGGLETTIYWAFYTTNLVNDRLENQLCKHLQQHSTTPNMCTSNWMKNSISIPSLWVSSGVL